MNIRHKEQSSKKTLKVEQGHLELGGLKRVRDWSPESRSNRPVHTYDGIARTCALNIRLWPIATRGMFVHSTVVGFMNAWICARIREWFWKLKCSYTQFRSYEPIKHNPSIRPKGDTNRHILQWTLIKQKIGKGQRETFISQSWHHISRLARNSNFIPSCTIRMAACSKSLGTSGASLGRRADLASWVPLQWSTTIFK